MLWCLGDCQLYDSHFERLTTRRLTNRCNGNLTRVFVWLRQASAPRPVPLISNVRRRREIALRFEGVLGAGSPSGIE